MAGTTNLLQWDPPQANMENDAAYAADSQRAGGATDPSLFLSPLANKLFYQMSTYLTALFTAFANKGFTTSDSNLSTLTAQCANFLTSADFRSNLQSVAYAPNVTFDMSQALGFELSLQGNVNITVVNAQVGDVVAFLFNQFAPGGYSVTFSGTPVLNPGALDTTSGAVSVQLFKVDASGHLLPASPMMSDINGIVGTPIGAVQPSSGKFTTLTLAAGAPNGYVLTGNGTDFVPVAPVPFTRRSRAGAFGTQYQNTGSIPRTIYVTAYTPNTYGSGWGMNVNVGTVSGSLTLLATGGVHNDGGQYTIQAQILPGEYYSVTTWPTNSASPNTSAPYGSNIVQPAGIIAWWEIGQ